MVTDPRFHRGRNTEGLMNTAKIVVHEEESKRVLVVFDLFRESICESGKAPHGHSHRKVLPLNVAGRDIAGIGPSGDRRSNCSNAPGWTVTAFRLGVGSVQLDQHRIVNVGAKGILNRL